MSRRSPAILIPVLLCFLLPPGLVADEAPRKTPPARVAPSLHHDVSPPLAELGERMAPARPTGLSVEIRNPSISLFPRAAPDGAPDPLLEKGARLQAAPEIATPAPSVVFDGLSDDDNADLLGTRVVPPDSDGDVGPDHYVQWNNLVMAVYDKAGSLLAGPFAGNALWAGFGGACESQNAGDPLVLYDHLADRWVLSQFTDVGIQCVAVSATADPAGSYHRYAFQVSGPTDLPDYPKMGLWPDGYYYAADNFGASFNAIAGAFERDAMLAGEAAGMVIFDLPCNGSECSSGILPADLEGEAPPAGTPTPFVSYWDAAWNGGAYPDGIRLWELDVDWGSPGDATFTDLGVLAGAALDRGLCGFGYDCIPQCDTTQKLDTLSTKTMWRAHYRHGDGHDTILVNTTVDVGGDRAGIRWAELRDPGSGWAIHQEGTHAPDDGLHRWMGSIAMDGAGNICLGYSVSSADLCPSIRYACRGPGDPAGTLPGGEVEMQAGGGGQLSADRWGDYASLSVDATDDCTFWFTSEYYQATGSFDFNTAIGAFEVESCPADGAPLVTIGEPLDGSVHPAESPVSLSGSALDGEDGDLSAALEWSSSLDGPLGTGAALDVTLSPGSHTVTAAVSDSLGQEGSDSVSFAVTSESCPLDGAISVLEVSAAELYRAIDSLTVGPDVTVAPTGALTLRVGGGVEMTGGVTVEPGGELLVRVGGDPCS